jgi:hypothetical protein
MRREKRSLKMRSKSLFRSQSERVVGSERVVIMRVVPREDVEDEFVTFTLPRDGLFFEQVVRHG